VTFLQRATDAFVHRRTGYQSALAVCIQTTIEYVHLYKRALSFSWISV